MTELRQSGITSYRRFVVDGFVTAFRDVFGATYNRDEQLVDLKVTNKFPLTREDFPCVVIDYVDRRVSNAGVAHEEWFDDDSANQMLRRWYHSRFEGSVNLDIWGLSPLDRDFLADGVIDVLRFGRLDAELSKWFVDIYGDINAPPPPTFQMEQLMVNTDEIDGRGNMEKPVPWGAEDKQLYGTGYTLEVHGGFYNTVITDVFEYVSRIDTYPYLEGDVPVLIDVPVTNPQVFFESGTVIGRGHVSGTQS